MLARKGRCEIMMMHKEKLQGALGKFKTQGLLQMLPTVQKLLDFLYHIAGELNQMQQQLYAVK